MPRMYLVVRNTTKYRCIFGLHRDRRYTTDLNNFPRTFLAYFDDDDRQPSSR